MSKKIKHLVIDDDVRVFVVGDIHGKYTLLRQKLKEIGFNFNSDLLIAVGDLVDRGTENEKCFNLLKEHWFISIKGNHEDFCVKGFSDDFYSYQHRRPNNGGDWFYHLPEDIQEHIANRFQQLPILLEVTYHKKKFGFVHANLPFDDWEVNKEVLSTDARIENNMIWSRGNIENYLETGEYKPVKNIDYVFLGHTILEKITTVGNSIYMDTGAFATGNLSIVDLKDYI